MDLKRFIRDVPDFPRPGVMLRDIRPLLGARVHSFAFRMGLAYLGGRERLRYHRTLSLIRYD